MFKLIENDKEQVNRFISCCRDDPVGAVVVTRLLAYGTHSGICSFYMDENGVCLSNLDGCLSIVAPHTVNIGCENDFAEEIRLLAKMLGCTTLLSRYDYRHILLFDAKKYPDTAITVDSENVRDIFPLVKAQNENVNFDDWYVDISHKLRHGLIHGKCVYSEGMVVSIALTSGETDCLACLSSVYTLEEYRRRGYGERCVRSVISEVFDIRPGRKICIMTNNDLTKEWYERMLK